MLSEGKGGQPYIVNGKQYDGKTFMNFLSGSMI